jgi:hypothetical protein
VELERMSMRRRRTGVVGLAVGVLVVWGTVSWAGPRLVVIPHPVSIGGKAGVHGHEFCGEAGCSTITVYVNDEVVASGVEPRDDGTFFASFTVLVPEAGVYELRATQENTTTGATIESTADLMVGNADEEEEEGPIIVE